MTTRTGITNILSHAYDPTSNKKVSYLVYEPTINAKKSKNQQLPAQGNKQH